jgi:hypothetical protein
MSSTTEMLSALEVPIETAPILEMASIIKMLPILGGSESLLRTRLESCTPASVWGYLLTNLVFGSWLGGQKLVVEQTPCPLTVCGHFPSVDPVFPSPHINTAFKG